MILVVVSNCVYFHPYLVKIHNLTIVFFKWVEPTNSVMIIWFLLGMAYVQGRDISFRKGNHPGADSYWRWMPVMTFVKLYMPIFPIYFLTLKDPVL